MPSAGTRFPPSALNVNQVRKLLASKDEALVEKVRAQWGTLRTDRNPQREQVIADMRQLLATRPGDAQAGQVVFNRVCGQCHKIYGVGQEVGPDLTSNGRSSLDQLLSNVLDPSLVIGAGYLARIVVTDDGRVLTGLPVEDSEQRLVLKMQGGKLETIAREDGRRSSREPVVAHARGAGKAAQAGRNGRPVRVSRARQAAERSGGPPAARRRSGRRRRK